MNSEELVKNVLNEIESFNLNDLPNIDLYMDQVTTYLNNKFSKMKRYEDDKLLTKTMINNYAKSHLLPPPEKKKYSKDHILTLAMIFFFKNIISINDVNTVITPLLETHFHNDEKPLEEIINNFLIYAHNNDISKPIIDELQDSSEIFKDLNIEDKDYMQTLGLISILSYDMIVRKMIVERLIDSLPKKVEDKKEKDESNNSKNKEDKQ